MLQRDTVSIEAGDADGASFGITKSGGASTTLNSVSGISRCSVETSSGAGSVSCITADCGGSEAEASGTSATGCTSIEDGKETGSDSGAGSTGSGRGGIGRSTLKEIGASFEKIAGSSGRTGSSNSRAGIDCGRSDSLIVSVCVFDPLT